MGSGRQRARTLSLGPPAGEPWVWMTSVMLGSLTYRSLGITARRILDRLLFEHCSHAGVENGRLICTYKQLEGWGVTTDDALHGFEELILCGFVDRTLHVGGCANGGEACRYALTWLPTLAGSSSERAPTHRWLKVNEWASRSAGNLRAIKAWKKRELAAFGRAKKKQTASPQVRSALPLKSGVAA